MKQYEKHYQESLFIPASVEDVFDYADEHANYYSHVIKFARLLGGRMNLEMDEGRGKSVGSRIRVSGKILGKSLSLEEVITSRQAPFGKAWESVGNPAFLIVGQYRYEIQIKRQASGSMLSVVFDSNPPEASGWLRQWFSQVYSKACAREMAKSTRNYFKKHRAM